MPGSAGAAAAGAAPPPPPGEAEPLWSAYVPAQPAKEPAGAGKIVGTVVVSFLLLVLVCLVAVTFLGRSSSSDDVATDAASSSEFGDVQHKAIVDGCISGGGTRSQCECVFEVIDDMYAPEDIVELEYELQQTGVYPAQLARAIQARCT